MNYMNFSGIQWDKGNRTKYQKHGVSIAEIEHAFETILVLLPTWPIHKPKPDSLPSEKREGRSVFIDFTIREAAIRPISARTMHEKEVSLYEKEAPNP